jgi:hypothetical protein
MFLMLLFLRGHYFIDLFCAVIFGHYFFNLAERMSYFIDTKLLGIPFHKRFPNFPQKCGYCKSPINDWLVLNCQKGDGNNGFGANVTEEH